MCLTHVWIQIHSNQIANAKIRQASSDLKNRMDLNKRISVNFFFFLTKAYLAHSPVFLKQNCCQIFVLMWALPQTSWAVRAAGVAPEKLLCESLQPCVKDKYVLHSESQGSLSHLISEMKCFPPAALTIQASAVPQTNPSRVACTCKDAIMALRERLFFLRQAPLWVLLVCFADSSHVVEHVVHVCSIYSLITLQGSAVKCAAVLLTSTHPASPSDKERHSGSHQFPFSKALFGKWNLQECNGSSTDHTKLLSRDMRNDSSLIIRLPMTCLVSD